ncbi:nuclear transport factor 2 family protein [Nitrosococcus wardiae]|uniref:Nuclear transport factor 2 family protein n=1 Tax=Nitrosococcus wardiae TaxID=1814290 RepID=A0A4P7BWR8_9GAMM|nr:nuclear transport factor 2 family protein [Nitrosococcus wardiae]QBQ53554.1 nuclear transport factor 2 family protein [Nitrosococcus wardiae]
MRNPLTLLRRLLGTVLLALLAALLISCAGGTEQPLSAAEEKEALKARVQARWEAVIAEDFDKAYEFTTPSYRQAYSKNHFFSQYGGQIDQEGVTVLEVTFQNPERTAAEVSLNVDFSAEGVTPGTLFRNTSYLKETWVKEEGQWWRVERR